MLWFGFYFSPLINNKMSCVYLDVYKCKHIRLFLFQTYILNIHIYMYKDWSPTNNCQINFLFVVVVLCALVLIVFGCVDGIVLYGPLEPISFKNGVSGNGENRPILICWMLSKEASGTGFYNVFGMTRSDIESATSR